MKHVTQKGKKSLISFSAGKGAVHKVSLDLRKTISSSLGARAAWDDITPLARNEWICWVESAKKDETRKRRIKRTRSVLIAGKRRPCCFAGCPHR